MPTTAPTARKQYGLRLLFAVTALVGVLLAGWRVYDGTWWTVKHRMHLLDDIHGDMTRADLEKALGKPSDAQALSDGSTCLTYPWGFSDPLHFYFDKNGICTGSD